MGKKRRIILVLFLLSTLLVGCGSNLKNIEKVHEKVKSDLNYAGIAQESYSYKVCFEENEERQNIEFAYDFLTNKEENISKGILTIALDEGAVDYELYREGGIYYIKVPNEEQFVEFKEKDDLINIPSRDNQEKILTMIKGNEELKKEFNIQKSGRSHTESQIDILNKEAKEIMKKIAARSVNTNIIKKQIEENIKQEVEKLNKDLNLSITDEDIEKVAEKEVEKLEEHYNNLLDNLKYDPLHYKIVNYTKRKAFEEFLDFNAKAEDVKIGFNIKYSYEEKANIPKSEFTKPSAIKEGNIIKEESGLGLLLNHLNK